MLRIDLAEVRAGPVKTAGELAADDPFWADLDLVLAAPLRVRGRLSGAGDRKYFWQGRLQTILRAQCRRCLTPVDLPLTQSLGLVFVAEGEGVEDEGCYVFPGGATVLDLSGAVREELLLALPQFVECRPDCRGLCRRCGVNLNQEPCSCPPESDPRWDALRGRL